MWDNRFAEAGFAYGDQPNDYLRDVAARIPAGEVLCIGEGEGRNAVYLAQQPGLRVTAVDASAVGLEKARGLAQERGVSLETIHADLAEYVIEPGRFSGVVEIFCHMLPDLRTQVHRAAVAGLAPGGAFVLEAYTPRQLEHKTGGPPVLERLYEPAEVRRDLEGAGLSLQRAEELVREVREGRYHVGPGAVLQVLGFRPG
jgi:2-polyprenyl-3-methyl-5-hydroxy-6-metoxy-1,4-benzoquinol methylase